MSTFRAAYGVEPGAIITDGLFESVKLALFIEGVENVRAAFSAGLAVAGNAGATVTVGGRTFSASPIPRGAFRANGRFDEAVLRLIVPTADVDTALATAVELAGQEAEFELAVRP